MSTVADLNDACAFRHPAGLRVPPKQLVVDDGVWWCAFDQVYKDWGPLWPWKFL